MEESVLFPLEKTRVKLGTVLIETVLSGDSLYTDWTFVGKKVKIILHLRARNSNQICEIEVLKLTPFDELCQLLIFSG